MDHDGARDASVRTVSHVTLHISNARSLVPGLARRKSVSCIQPILPYFSRRRAHWILVYRYCFTCLHVGESCTDFICPPVLVDTVVNTGRHTAHSVSSFSSARLVSLVQSGRPCRVKSLDR